MNIDIYIYIYISHIPITMPEPMYHIRVGGTIENPKMYNVEFADAVPLAATTEDWLINELNTMPNIDPNHVPFDGRSALINSCLHGKPKVALRLLECPDIDYNYIDKHEITAFIAACMDGHHDVAVKLLEMPDLNYDYGDTYRAIFYVIHHKWDIIMNMMAKKSDLDISVLDDEELTWFNTVTDREIDIDIEIEI
jgi:hypothetical protein